jgi:putative membrane protein
MRILGLLLKLAVFFLLLGFAFKNADTVTVRYFLDFEWQAPLVFILLLVFGLGIFAGILTNVMVVARQRRELSALKRELHAQKQVRAPLPLEAA